MPKSSLATEGHLRHGLRTRHERRVPHISLVFREMWDTTALNREWFWTFVEVAHSRFSPGRSKSPNGQK
jgi:hypothetical protein